MLDIAQCALFVHVAEAGGLTRAAALMGSSAPSLSRQLAAIEERCGGHLFIRTGRGLSLTELGVRLLPHAQRLMMEARDFELEIRNAAGKPQGGVHFGMLTAAADPLLTILLRRLASEFPGIKLRVTEGNSSQLAQWLGVGKLDIAFLVREKEALTSRDTPLSLNPLQLLVAAADPLARLEMIGFAALAGLPLILPAMPNGLRTSLQQAARKQTVDLLVALEIDSLALQKQLVAGGIGYGIVSRGTITDSDKSMLTEIKIAGPSLERAMVLSSTTQRPATLAARIVLDLTTSIAGELRGTGIWQGIGNRS